jgi:RND family efflux transporter MFP subunit
MSKRRIIAILLMVLLLAGLVYLSKVRTTKKITHSAAEIHAEEGMPVTTSVVTVGSIEDSIPVTGELKAFNSVILSSKIMGKIDSVSVREGDYVSAGQVVIRLDQTDALAAYRQASAALETARARLSQAITAREVTVVSSNAAIEQAKAALAAAEANYEKIKKGARTQERMVAENAVATAKANMDNAQANLRRMKQLFAEGAIAQAQLDVAQTQYDVALAQYNSAKENLSLVIEGARGEDIRAAQAAVDQAREALRTAKANAAQIALRDEDINSARAGVSQAQAALTTAEEQLRNTYIRSTVSGFVAQRMAEPGENAAPGIALMSIVDVRSLYFEASVSETVIARIKPGQIVSVKVDAYPDKTFTGKVEKINPAAKSSVRSFGVRIRIPNSTAELKPGMFARGTIITTNKKGVLLVPQSAIEYRGGENLVFTVDGTKAVMHKIKKGLSNPDVAEILPPTDIKDGDEVITSGKEYLQDGMKIRRRGRI